MKLHLASLIALSIVSGAVYAADVPTIDYSKLTPFGTQSLQLGVTVQAPVATDFAKFVPVGLINVNAASGTVLGTVSVTGNSIWSVAFADNGGTYRTGKLCIDGDLSKCISVNVGGGQNPKYMSGIDYYPADVNSLTVTTSANPPATGYLPGKYTSTLKVTQYSL